MAMEFLLQQGWGMMDLDREFVGKGMATGVILSPRAHSIEQATRHANEIRRRGGEVLFDPQFYEPRTERNELRRFPYWRSVDFSTSTFDQGAAASFCERCVNFEVGVLHVSKVIIPGRYSNAVNEHWLEMHRTFAEKANAMAVKLPLYSTIAIGPDVVLNHEVFENMLDEVSGYPVSGVYLVFRHPSDAFLISDETFLYNLLNGLLSLSLARKDVILGYANQQSLLFAAAGVKTIASGNFRNTRSFNPRMFDVQDRVDMQRATWYYDGNTLSEFRINSLALAYRRGLRGGFGPICEHCRPLLESSNPANVRWGEPQAFRHFLHELRRQWLGLNARSATRTTDKVTALTDRVRSALRALTSRGFHLGDRSFYASFDPTVSALTAFVADRSSDLRRF